MPTEFCDCDECNHLDWLPLDHNFNVNYKKDLEMHNSLICIGFPEHISKNIVKHTHKLTECKQCKINFKYNNPNRLCEKHYQLAIEQGNYYRSKNPLCDKCCWQEVS